MSPKCADAFGVNTGAGKTTPRAVSDTLWGFLLWDISGLSDSSSGEEIKQDKDKLQS